MTLPQYSPHPFPPVFDLPFHLVILIISKSSSSAMSSRLTSHLESDPFVLRRNEIVIIIMWTNNNKQFQVCFQGHFQHPRIAAPILNLNRDTLNLFLRTKCAQSQINIQRYEVFKHLVKYEFKFFFEGQCDVFKRLLELSFCGLPLQKGICS